MRAILIKLNHITTATAAASFSEDGEMRYVHILKVKSIMDSPKTVLFLKFHKVFLSIE